MLEELIPCGKKKKIYFLGVKVNVLADELRLLRLHLN